MTTCAIKPGIRAAFPAAASARAQAWLWWWDNPAAARLHRW
jgi:hypothetical protein